MKAKIPLAAGQVEEFNLLPGTSIVLVGANGAGKTRLGVRLEREIGNAGREAHRIAAHRSLTFNDTIEVISSDRAENLLRFGYDRGGLSHKENHRWGSQPATKLLSDFDDVLRALYAEQNDVAISHLERHREDAQTAPPLTKLLQLKTIWQRLLPHRELVIKGANIKIRSASGGYNASSLSDGERVIFYLIGQTLLVAPNAVFIIDEPELHIHRSILADLWDELEGVRRDLTFIYTTHDLEFATTRHTECKLALSDYHYSPDAKNEYWTVSRIEEAAGLSEQVVTRILGSRRAILFVEGDVESLDSAIYRRVYPGRTVIPVGGHDDVIRSVGAFGAHAALHRLNCAGIIDRDDQSDDDVQTLVARNVLVTPASEIENMLLFPLVFYAIARSLQFTPSEARSKIATLSDLICDRATKGAERFAVEFAKRRIDRAIKTVGLGSKDSRSLIKEFDEATKIDVAAIVKSAESKLQAAIASRDLYRVLSLYDDKGLLAEAARLLNLSKSGLEEYVGRLLASKVGRIHVRILRSLLPRLP